MAESKECLWVVVHLGTDRSWVYRSRANARAYKAGKPKPRDYRVLPAKWGPERQKSG